VRHRTGVPREGQRTGPEPTAHPLAGHRTPEYVIVLWVSEQLREQARRNNAALAKELQERGHRRNAGLAAEREAEP
jgi:hypothetical protein